MASRALWTGSIAFGLVNIPIELHRAIRETRPRFRLLHAKDKSPVRFERVCEREDRAVAWGEVVKGYEYVKGKFVVLTPGRHEAGGAREDAHPRYPQFRPRGRHRRPVLRDAVLRRAGQGRRARLRRPAGGSPGIRQDRG